MMPTLTYEQIPISNPIARAKMQLGLSGISDHDIWFETLADEAARHLDCLSIWVKRVKKIDIDGTVACLPKGMRKFIALRFVDNCTDNGSVTPNNQLSQPATNTGNIVVSPFLPFSFADNAVYADLKFLSDCGCQNPFYQGFLNSFEIQGNNLFFHGTPISTQALIAYYGLNIDDDGLMMIYADYERAIWNYICWMFCLQNPEKYPVNVREEYRLTYAAQKAWIKSEQVLQHFTNTKRQVSEWANALIADKNWTL